MREKLLEEAGALTAVYRGLSYERWRDQGESLVKNKTLLCFSTAESCCPISIFPPSHSMKWNGNFRTVVLRGFWQIKGDKLATRPSVGDREPMFFARVHSLQAGQGWHRRQRYQNSNLTLSQEGCQGNAVLCFSCFNFFQPTFVLSSTNYQLLAG